MTADLGQLAALRALEENLEKLEDVALKCWNAKKITGEDEDEYDRLLRELQRLYGGLRNVVGAPVYQIPGRGNFDGFQQVLSVPSLSSLLNDQSNAWLWQQQMTGAQSIVRQTIGKVEEVERRGGLAVSPEVAARWKWLIAPLERMRRLVVGLVAWASSRPKFLDRPLRKLEGSPLFRVANVLSTSFFVFIMAPPTLAGVIGVIAWLVLH